MQTNFKTLEKNETPQISLKSKNIEAFLIDSFVVLTTLFSDKLSFWQEFEASSFPASVYDVQNTTFSTSVWIFLLLAVLTMLYAGARKSVPENQFFQLFYGIGLIGVMLLFPGLVALAFDSLAIGIPALIITYVILMKQDSFLGFANKLYDHKSRVLVLPILVSLFISGAEYFMKTRIDFQYVGITIVMLYIPVRLLLAFKEPYRFYHFLIIMATMVYFSIQTHSNLKNAPTTPGWDNVDGYLGDRVQVIKESGKKALLFKQIKSDKSIIIVHENPDRSWSIDTSATRNFNEKLMGDISKWP